MVDINPSDVARGKLDGHVCRCLSVRIRLPDMRGAGTDRCIRLGRRAGRQCDAVLAPQAGGRGLDQLDQTRPRMRAEGISAVAAVDE